MKKHILVPVDFTKIAETGLATAINIAKKVDAKITMLHVIDDQGPANFRPDGDMIAKHKENAEHDRFMAELIKKSRAELGELFNRFDFQNLETKSVIEFGKFKEGLKSFLDSNKVDLIVIGTSGETSLSEFFSGNHATQTFRIADVPVLALKDCFSITNLNDILLLTDLQDYKKETIGLIRNFAEMFDLKVHIAHIRQNKDLVEENIEQRLKTFAQENNFKNYEIFVLEKGRKTEKIHEFTEEMNIDLIATITEGNSGLVRLIFGSDTEKFLHKLENPLLTVSE